MVFFVLLLLFVFFILFLYLFVYRHRAEFVFPWHVMPGKQSLSWPQRSLYSQAGMLCSLSCLAVFLGTLVETLSNMVLVQIVQALSLILSP